MIARAKLRNGFEGMKKTNSENSRLIELPALLTGVLFFAFFFLFVMMRIQPALVYYQQQPPFFLDSRFFTQHLAYPGGLLDFVAAFILQLFRSNWIGAAVLTILVLKLVYIAYRILGRDKRSNLSQLVLLLPSLFLLLAHSEYAYQIQTSMALLIALSALLLYRDGLSKNSLLKGTGTVILGVLLYIVSPGVLLLFSGSTIVYEWTRKQESLKNRLLWSLLPVALVFLLPWLGKNLFYLIPTEHAWFYHLPWIDPQVSTWPFLLVLGSTGLLILFSNLGLPGLRPSVFQRNWIVSGSTIIVLAVVFVGSSFFIKNKNERIKLFIRHKAQTRQWVDVLKMANTEAAREMCCAFHINESLFHTGQLCYHFFSFGQPWGNTGLYMNGDAALRHPLDMANFYFDVGHVTEAERYASEALSVLGEAPWILQRLALINIVQNEAGAAKIVLNRLRQNPFFRKWADHYLSSLSDPQRMRADTELQKIHFVAPKTDFIIMTRWPWLDFKRLFEQAPMNRMAFEYVLMTLMLERETVAFLNTLKKMPNLEKQRLPRHFEEALIVMSTLKGADRLEFPRVSISQKSQSRFQAFQQTLQQFGGSKTAAQPVMRNKFGNTYWYYLMYNN